MKQDIITNLKVNNNEIRIMRVNNEEYISLTDLASYQNKIEWQANRTLARKQLELLYNNRTIKELESNQDNQITKN